MLNLLDILFIIPDPNSFPSGGNEYNKQLTTQLSALGVSIGICTIENKPHAYDDKIVIWDSLYLYEKKNLNQGTHYLLVHHLESLYPPNGWTSTDFLNQKERRHLDNFDGFITSSPYTTTYLKAAKLGQKPIFTIPPAIDFSPRIVMRTPSSPLRVMLVANITKRKGIYPFLQQLSTKNSSNLDMKIIGNPDLDPAYTEACRSFWKDTNNIHFLGSLQHSEVLRVYEQSDLFISTSYMETYGMAIQEAIAHGLPLLLLDGGNVKNHLQNDNGILCKSMKALTKTLLKLSNEPPLITYLKKNALKLAEKPTRTWSDAAQELITYFSSK